MNLYAISKDSPQELKALSDALNDEYPREDHRTITFLSDPELQLIQHMDMKNEDQAFRGFGLLTKSGEVVFVEKNDHWGEELDQSLEKISQEYKKIQKD